MSRLFKVMLIVSLCVTTSACIGTVVGAVVDTTIEVVKIPFKVGAAVIDVATDDDFTDVAESDSSHSELSSDEAAIKMENVKLR